MNRRDLLRRSSLAAAAYAATTTFGDAEEPSPAPVPNAAVRRVLAVTKCHLDVGFTDTQANVIRKYFDVYYPAAIEVASRLRTGGGNPEISREAGARHTGGGQVAASGNFAMPNATTSPRYTWTTGSWLLYTYLEQATPAQRKRMEQAIADGDIAWHALPFSWQTEVLSRSMIAGGLGFSQELDRRFGTKTSGAKMTDVPGHTRGIIAPLAEAGVTLLDIGVNAASTPPEVPDIFRWQDHAGHEIIVLYHRHDYGSTLPVPGSDLVVDVEVKNDNGGPHTTEEITAIHQRLHRQFPNAVVQAASLTEVANAVAPFRKHLPVVTGEIGDTWIYGVPSDPPKVARFRELSRLRDEWLAQGKLHIGDAVDRAYLQHLLLCAEHTWGTDTKTYLDYKHYRPAEIAQAEAEHLPGYAKMETSWQEKRDNITAAVATLPPPLQAEANARLAGLAAPPPAACSPCSKDLGSSPLSLENRHLRVAVDPETGAVTSLLHKPSNREWASPSHPIALLIYQTLSAEDFARFIKRYLVVDTWWGPRDFGKPEINCFEAQSAEYPAFLDRNLVTSSSDRSSLALRFTWAEKSLLHSDEPPSNHSGCPADLNAAHQNGPQPRPSGNRAFPNYLELRLTLRHDSPALELTLSFSKPANRLPEALWLTFDPVVADPKGWLLTKSGQPVLPTEVLEGGGRAIHAVDEIRYADPHGGLSMRSLDAPVVALGVRSPLNFSRPLPDLSGGMHVSLFNNAWGTNYPQWAGGDWQFRFTLTLS